MAAPPADPATIARGITEAFPELGDIAVTKTLGIGFNSIAVETDGGLVFRIARTEGTATRFAMETRLLPILRESLPVAVPEPKFFAPQTNHFPFGVIGYPKIEGRTLQPGLVRADNLPELADQAARVLVALHSVPRSGVADVGLPQPDVMAGNYRSLARETLPVLKERMKSLEFERLDQWWQAFLADERMAQFEHALTHGDFWFENMIVDETATRILGVVDWEHASIGDRAQDLATLLHLGQDFVSETRRAYREQGGLFDDSDHYRMERLWELRDFYGVLYGIRFNDEEELLDSIRKLREGPVLTASDAS